MKIKTIPLLVFLILFSWTNAQKNGKQINRESDVPSYQLPKLLESDRGSIKNKAQWEKYRRPQILEQFASQVYGKVPGQLPIDRIEVLEMDTEALGGKAIRKQLMLHFKKGDRSMGFPVLLYIPKRKQKVPVFMGYNFLGNHSIAEDPFILIDGKKEDEMEKEDLSNFKPESRGSRVSRWPVEEIINAGYALLTVNYNTVDPDKDDFSNGIHPLFYQENQTAPEPDEWGALASWAWSMSRVLDYLETEPLISADKAILFGHSRLGKAALWAGANDPRFSIVISNNSGCGGAAISRRRFGEKVVDINTKFPHWFAKNFHQYNDNESELPVDQHMLVALMAPRPVYIASASKDDWADPMGEFLSAKFATSVYQLYGFKEFNFDSFPKVNSPIHKRIGYHLREGKHNITHYDWDQFIKFANQHLK